MTNTMPNTSLLFAQRYGHRPLPDVMDYTLCKQFRSSLGNAISAIIESDESAWKFFCDNEGCDYDLYDPSSEWRDLFFQFQTEVLNKSYLEISPIRNTSDAIRFVLSTVDEGAYSDVLSLCEMLLTMLRNRGSKSKNQKDVRRIAEVFKQGLAPYTVDTSREPYRIDSVLMPEHGNAITDSIAVLHKEGDVNAHQSLREAARQISRQDYPAAIISSIKALESVGRRIVDDKEKTLGKAIRRLEKQGFFSECHPGLVEVIKKLWAYANPIRHGQPGSSTQTGAQSNDEQSSDKRDEAVLVFCLCASLAGFLSRLAASKAESGNS